MAENRGSLSFFTTYRPPVKLDIYSCPYSEKSQKDEICMTDEVSYNSNGLFIPPEALKKILKHPKLASEGHVDDVDSGRLTGLIFVSERGNGLETLHLSLRLDGDPPIFKIFTISDVYGTFNGVRMEDSGCIAGDYLIYVTTKDPALHRRQPWTAVYKTNLITGETTPLTPSEQADLNPAVSPCGTKIAMASFQGKLYGWDGELDYQNTNIFVMNVEEPYNRKIVVEHGSWPSWGSKDVLFFHKKDENQAHWGVFRADISGGGLTSDSDITRVTPVDIDAVTPAAIDDTTVAVATIRESSYFSHVKRDVNHYRHIEIFDSTGKQKARKITQKMSDHYNPFVIADFNGEMRIGYHRCYTESLPKDGADLLDKLEEIQSPEPGVDLFRASGAFPSFSKDLSKLAIVDNEFKTVYVLDSKGSYVVYQAKESNRVFAPVWNQDPDKDTLYICEGPAFQASDTVEICAIVGACSGGDRQFKRLTNGFNNAFPCTNPDGTKLVFRSTRDGGEKNYKNLYIIEDLQSMENGEGEMTRLTNGPWVDTHCEWSPNGEWIVFASNRDRPSDELDHGLDTGYFAIYLVKVKDPDGRPVRVMGSRSCDLAGHVNHPFFSPDGRSLSMVSDLAAVSCDPISLPQFMHSARPYGDLFIIDIDPDDIDKNWDVKDYRRITHSRYENSIAVWTSFSGFAFSQVWNEFFTRYKHKVTNYAHDDGGETWQSTGHICVHAPRRC